ALPALPLPQRLAARGERAGYRRCHIPVLSAKFVRIKPERLPMKTKNWKAAFVSIVTFACALPAFADVTVSDAWTRSTVPGQKVAGVFMRIVSTVDTALIEATSPSAKIVEIHEMTKEGNVMKMKAVDRLPVPAEKPVELTPAGYHMMLFELKAPLNVGDKVPLKLTFENRGGRKLTVDVEATVRPPGADAGPPKP